MLLCMYIVVDATLHISDIFIDSTLYAGVVQATTHWTEELVDLITACDE